MSYRIEYGSDIPLMYQKQKGKSNLRILTALCMILFSLGVGRFWPEGKLMLQKFLLPGDPTILEQAFSSMMGDLSDGAKLEDAMLVFCQQIIDNGTGVSD